MMNLETAKHILQISDKTDIRKTKQAFRRLLLKYHPDNQKSPGKEDEAQTRRIIEAYQVLMNSIGTKDNESEIKTWWKAAENMDAFCDRSVYVQYRFFGHDDLPIIEVAHGKYLWMPELEDFPLFTKSVMFVCKSLYEDAVRRGDGIDIKELFHLLIQEFIDPILCLKTLEQYKQGAVDNFDVYRIAAHAILSTDTVLDKMGSMEIIARGNVLTLIVDKDRLVGRLSFDEDYLYYIVIPLIREKSSQISIRIEMNDKADPDHRKQWGGKKVLPVYLQLMIGSDFRIPLVCNRAKIYDLIGKQTTR